jgi:hypothetical protein
LIWRRGCKDKIIPRLGDAFQQFQIFSRFYFFNSNLPASLSGADWAFGFEILKLGVLGGLAVENNFPQIVP